MTVHPPRLRPRQAADNPNLSNIPHGLGLPVWQREYQFGRWQCEGNQHKARNRDPNQFHHDTLMEVRWPVGAPVSPNRAGHRHKHASRGHRAHHKKDDTHGLGPTIDGRAAIIDRCQAHEFPKCGRERTRLTIAKIVCDFRNRCPLIPEHRFRSLHFANRMIAMRWDTECISERVAKMKSTQTSDFGEFRDGNILREVSLYVLGNQPLLPV